MQNKPNTAKIRESVLFLLNNTSAGLDQYKIAKAIFLADVGHLNRFGRPITYDNYVAMKFGPVPSKTYDLLRHKPESLDVAIKKSNSSVKIYSALRQHEELELSESDESELQQALAEVEKSTFSKLKQSTHNHIAWKTAWNKKISHAPYMDYALLFEERDQEQADYIAWFSKQDECTA